MTAPSAPEPSTPGPSTPDPGAFAATTFGQALRCPVTVRRALKVSGVVGTLLVLINQGDLLLAGMAPPLWKILLTYLVPYSVSSYSTAVFMVEIGRQTGQDVKTGHRPAVIEDRETGA
ncbi:nitrate/nitrite transporter NrtS [Eilatimonas milleporae]|uniref:Uncharacterized protein n=1 Tax=Eilatimonas milleporae TaxID=911205 RepID=A0A3M0CE70_9PROT|nr:nitrate/nitrite transporter NrtS [Eilatimonas milleporae]RMB08114.1 hypothetical protein BXY39_2210 [Eilatimonas milleporae]